MRDDVIEQIKRDSGNLVMRERWKRKDHVGENNLYFSEYKVKEKQEKKQLQSVTVTSHLILACTKKNCEEHNHKEHEEITHFQKNKSHTHVIARCKYTL